ncbi:MAG: 50S ribosomal protein L29 [Gammaproteobacteria bacterium]|nr:50S ribosomal protein L29 [Gammaproteobacteria bacterium]
MKSKAYQKMSIAELKSELNALLREQFNLGIQKTTGQLSKFHLIKNARQNIARVKTILREKESAGVKHE